MRFQGNFYRIVVLSEMYKGAFVDIRGKVIFVGALDTRRVRNETEIVRQILLQDESGIAYITLWRKCAYDSTVRLNADIALFAVRTTDFDVKPSLGTWYDHTSITTVAPVNVNQAEVSPWLYTVTAIRPGTVVYNVCLGEDCKFKDFDSTANGFYYCAKCGISYKTEDTAVGVDTPVDLTHEADGSKISARILTLSIRRIYPDLQKKWGNGVGKSEEELMEMVQKCLPRLAVCMEMDMKPGYMAVLSVSDTTQR